MSETIQNKLIAVIENKIHSDILNEVRSAKFYSIIVDEVTDTANKKELSLVIRYGHDEEIREVFVDFLEVERITERVLGEAILMWLRNHDISPADVRGQCTMAHAVRLVLDQRLKQLSKKKPLRQCIIITLHAGLS